MKVRGSRRGREGLWKEGGRGYEGEGGKLGAMREREGGREGL